MALAVARDWQKKQDQLPCADSLWGAALESLQTSKSTASPSKLLEHTTAGEAGDDEDSASEYYLALLLDAVN